MRKITTLGVALATLMLGGCGPATDAPTTATSPADAAGSTPAAAATAQSSVHDADTLARIDDYERRAKALAATLGSGVAGDDERSEAVALIDLAAEINPSFVRRHPQCGAYLDAALQVRERWSSMDVEAIERDYHDDAALPAEGIGPACYHMKDLIVHPASVAALLAQPEPDLVHAKREIDEVIAHVAVVRGG